MLFCTVYRPPNAQELAERAPQVIQCNDALREVTLYQNVGGKQMSRTFRYDKVSTCSIMCSRRDTMSDKLKWCLQQCLTTA